MAALLVGPFLCPPALAQSEAERIKDLERKLERSMQLIEQLTRRVNELERGPAAPAAPGDAGRVKQLERQVEALEKDLGQISSSRIDRAEAVVPVHGFADVGYEHLSRPRADNRRSGFVLGNLDLFLTPNFGRAKMLAELVFEVGEDGSLATDLERLQFGYTFSDSLTAWIGRFHTPYGYWNTAFHHGAQIQTAATRPRFLEFEDRGGFLPAHTVGLWANGRVRAGDGKIVYDAFVGNGGRIVDGILDFNARRDDNSNRLVGANVGYRFGGALDGLLLGVHGFQEEVGAFVVDVPQARTRVRMAGGYGYADMDNWELIAEYYRFRNADLSEGTGHHSSWAAFLQVGRTFFDLWTPYYRWEKAALDPADGYFAAQDSGRSYKRNVVGLRYTPNLNTAIKIEANRTREIPGDEKSHTETRAQFAVRF